MFRFRAVMFGLCLFGSCFPVSSSVTVKLEKERPTKEAVWVKLHEYLQVMNGPGDRSQKAMETLQKLGSASRLQVLLADLYTDATARERIAILHALKQIGVEKARSALPLIAQDFATAWRNHPNDLSFASYYVMEAFMHEAWRVVPEPQDRDQAVVKDLQKLPATAEEMPISTQRLSPDKFIRTGSLSERQILRQLILKEKLNKNPNKQETEYAVPSPELTGWVRIVGHHAFVRLRGQSSGIDLLFIKPENKPWALLSPMGRWVN